MSQNAIDYDIATIIDGSLLTMYRAGFLHVSVQTEYSGTKLGRRILPVMSTDSV